MSAHAGEVLGHLEAMIAFDTRNPPREIDTGGIFAYLREQLPGFECTVVDHGEGCVSLLARRGQPGRVFNFHLDTVPATSGWTVDPLHMRTAEGHVTGLGACDIKGAAAAMVTAARHTSRPLALLFTSDEEAGASRCVREFLATDHGFRQAIVAEPTRCRAVLAHRGLASVELRMRGIAGHSSERRAFGDNAIHRAVAWAQRALAYAGERAEDRYQTLAGLPFNIGRIEGGIKPNMIAEEAKLRFGLRPLPGSDVEAILQHLHELAPPEHVESWELVHSGPTLPASGGGSEDSLAAARALITELEIPESEPVDFWTEASLFAAAGLTAIVFGPGDIRQAHTADEWVAEAQLHTALETYLRIIER